jgi:electron transfer flavoprotein alpha subunit
MIASITLKDGKATKSSLEAASYAVALAAAAGAEAIAVAHGPIEGDGGLGATGITKVLHHAMPLHDSAQIARLVSAAALNSQAVVMAHDPVGKAVAPAVAVRLGAGLVSGVTSLPEGGTVGRNVFSGKAMAQVEVTTGQAVYTVTPNTFPVSQGHDAAAVESFEAEIGTARVTVKAFHPSSSDGQVPLPEADRVVSAGRGLKAKENWGIVEDLARALGATTACSRPVADIGWRPHHEHVGQTGVTIRPSLYIAAGISGAIQHLAGVNQSKVIVVINTDPEAPFFKAADYGIVGDAFEVLPKLTAAIEALKD